MNFEGGAIYGVDRDRVPNAVGRATIAWNNVSLAVYHLFQHLSGLDEGSAKATFFCVNSDRSQRDMLHALVEARLEPKNAALAKQAKTILGKINGLSGRRNDILHIVFVNDHDPNNVRPFNERGHLKGKSGTDLLVSIEKLTSDCLEQACDLMNLTISLLEARKNQRRVVEALLSYKPRPASAGDPSQMGFGLLDFPATTDSSPGKDPQ